MNDLEFVQRAVKGDKLAWNEFTEKYSRLIYSYIYSVLKTRGLAFSDENVNDLYQEILLSLVKDNFKKLSSFKAKNGCSLASWLRLITINAAIDYMRKHRPALSLDAKTEEGVSFQDIIADKSPAAADTLAADEKIGGLQDCIKELEKDDKFFIELYLNRGLTLNELKDYYRVSRGAVDMRKSRIIERLRDCFKRKGFPLEF